MARLLALLSTYCELGEEDAGICPCPCRESRLRLSIVSAFLGSRCEISNSGGVSSTSILRLTLVFAVVIGRYGRGISRHFLWASKRNTVRYRCEYAPETSFRP